MKLAFVPESATGRLQERANALADETEGTRVVFICARILSGPQTSTPAGRLIHRLLVAMGSHYAWGSDFHPLREVTDLGELEEAIRLEGARLNSYPSPAGPQSTSMVLVADTPRIWRLAERFGVTVDPARLVNAVEIDFRELAER